MGENIRKVGACAPTFLILQRLYLQLTIVAYSLCSSIKTLKPQPNFMRQFILLFAVAFIGFIPTSCTAQKNTSAGNTIVTTSKTIYAKAVEFGDFNTAIVAAHTILANSPNDYHYMDSLVSLYYTSGNLVAAVNVGNTILDAAPQNTTVRELVANSLIGLGMNGEAIVHYNDLYSRTSNIIYLYNIATTEFGMKNYTDCGLTVERILKADGNMTNVAINGADGKAQDIPVKAAAYNIKGAIAVVVNNTAIAKESFEEALKIAPDFSLAKSNLEELKKPTK
jgi:tetratricopeptide (TPR) repeat protein